MEIEFLICLLLAEFKLKQKLLQI